jgi:hypothetical protein
MDGVLCAFNLLFTLYRSAMSNIKVYVASPYTIGGQAKNVRRSIEVADKLRELGFLPFCPLLSHFWDMIIPHSYDYWMAMDLEWLKECDVVLRLSGQSKGADLEEEVAKMNHIPVVYTIEQLRELYNV